MFQASKPIPAVLNRRHTLARGLTQCFPMTERGGPIVDLVGRVRGVETAATIPRTPDVAGIGPQFSNSPYFNCSARLGPSALPMTIAFGLRRGSAAANEGLLTTTKIVANYIGVYSYVLSNGDVWVSLGNNKGQSSGERRSYNTSATFMPGTKKSVVFRITSLNDISVWHDGVQQAGSYSGSASSFVAGSAGGEVGRAYYVFGDQRNQGHWDYLYIWNRSLSASEIMLLHTNPYVFLVKPSYISLTLREIPAHLSTVALSWQDNSDGGSDGFSIERSVTSGEAGFSEIDSVGSGTTNYNDDGLPPGTYWYRVKALSATLGDSDYSNVAEIMVS